MPSQGDPGKVVPPAPAAGGYAACLRRQARLCRKRWPDDGAQGVITHVINSAGGAAPSSTTQWPSPAVADPDLRVGAARPRASARPRRRGCGQLGFRGMNLGPFWSKRCFLPVTNSSTVMGA